MSDFLHWLVILLSVGSFLGCIVLILLTSRPRKGEAAQGEVTGHVWDDDLVELNNPLPRWWLWLFYITIVFGLVYMALYPSLGNLPGSLQWNQKDQYDKEIAAAEAKYGPIFEKFAQLPIESLAKNPEALAVGQSLFMNYCSTCHGSDAGGAPGFPNLKDQDWLYGGTPAIIKSSISQGRSGIMPALGAALGDEGIDQVAHYVLGLSGAPINRNKAAEGKAKYEAMCSSCHGLDGAGSQTIGAPKLNDSIWLYGGTIRAIRTTITKGRNGQMPGHQDLLGEARVHLLTAYVYSLSNK